MTLKNQPFEDASRIKHGDFFQCHVSFQGGSPPRKLTNEETLEKEVIGKGKGLSCNHYFSGEKKLILGEFSSF